MFLTANMIGFNFSENDVKEFGENTDPIKVTKDGRTYCKVLQGNGFRNYNDSLNHRVTGTKLISNWDSQSSDYKPLDRELFQCSLLYYER